MDLVQLQDPATGTQEYELIEARIQTQYYIQYTFDFLWICAFIAILIKILTWKNWPSTIFTGMKNK